MSEDKTYTKRMVSKIVISGISFHFLYTVVLWTKIPEKIIDLINT